MKKIMKVKEWVEHKIISDFVKKISEALKKPKVNPETGAINLKFEIKNTDEDYFFPINTKSDESVTFKSKQQ